MLRHAFETVASSIVLYSICNCKLLMWDMTSFLNKLSSLFVQKRKASRFESSFHVHLFI